MEQLTYEQAIAIYQGGAWKDWTDEEVVKFQLFQNRLCVPFDRFHEAVEKVLCSPVWTHEFAFSHLLQAEYNQVRPAPSFADILLLIPEEKRIVVVVGDDVDKSAAGRAGMQGE